MKEKERRRERGGCCESDSEGGIGRKHENNEVSEKACDFYKKTHNFSLNH